MNISIEIPALMVMASSLLKRCILDAQRVESKRYFRELEAGNPVLLSDLSMEDDSVLRVSLEMNASEFCGQLNYSAFRDQLTMLIDTYSRYLKAGQEPKVLSDDSGVQHVIVLPAVSEIRGQRNALVMGFDQNRPANLRLKLMFVDAAQFMEKAS
ncbi:hypothetical protein [Spongiibacter tropicus]|uniref:hypothetical protein n=1 Tax=Spongiibacter tropicus TaxID=454602 RepID=UPI0035BE8B4A